MNTQSEVPEGAAGSRRLGGMIAAVWNGRLAALGVGGAVGALGLAAAIAAPASYAARAELAGVTLLAAAALGLAAGFSHGVSNGGPLPASGAIGPGARPPLTLIEGGA